MEFLIISTIFFFPDIGDVTKQCDLNGFYRHLYETMTTTEPATTKNSSSQVSTTTAKFREVDKKKTRNIRKRVMSDDEKDSESDKEATSDKKRKSSEVDDPKPKLDTSQVEIIPPVVESKEPSQSEIKDEPKDDENDKDEDKSDDDSQPDEAAQIDEQIDLLKKKMIPERKTDIWIKRTVGELFEAALQRYKERKVNLMTVC